MSTLNEVFKQAKHLLQQDGWIQGDYGEVDGPKCAMGALRVACIGDIDVVPGTPEEDLLRLHQAGDVLTDCATEATKRKLGKLPDGWGKMPVPAYNDEFAEGEDDVLAIFDCAIEKTKEATS